jgi:hypothetical protein
MANPMLLLSRKLVQKFPWLQSPGNRMILVIAFILVAAFALNAGMNAREDSEITNCKAKGGTPVFVTRVYEYPSDDGSFRREYQVFDRCQPFLPTK